MLGALLIFMGKWFLQYGVVDLFIGFSEKKQLENREIKNII